MRTEIIQFVGSDRINHIGSYPPATNVKVSQPFKSKFPFPFILEDYALQRLSAPAQLTASRGDTSVFLKWTKVEDASFYTLVRGLKVIADSLTVESYEDDSAPDTLTEYRIYAVDNQG